MSGDIPSLDMDSALPGPNQPTGDPPHAFVRAGFWQEALANLQTTIDERVDASGLGEGLELLRDRALDTVDAARETCRREVDAFKREQEEHFGSTVAPRGPRRHGGAGHRAALARND